MQKIKLTESTDARNDLCRRLSAPKAPRLPIRLAAAVFAICLVACLAAAAWSKTARTLLIFEQIEAAK